MTSVLGRYAFRFRAPVLVGTALLGALSSEAFAQAANLPEIRLSQRNVVPACVTPERLMAFLRQRNGNLDPRFQNIAHYYKQHGEAWRVRWDYAFFQMAIETNFLTYRRPNGRMGDVDPRQNNFAGIGTTGGGVPGDSFPDVSTGVLGQIQHLVVYSGETIGNPVAPRTRLKQDHILAKSRELNRPVRFSDLARRWAVDPKYASSIEWVASRYRAQYCQRDGAPNEAEILPWHRSPRADAAANGFTTASVGLPQPKGVAAAAPAPSQTGAPEREEATHEPPRSESVAALPPLESAGAEADAGGTGTASADSMFALFSPPAGFAGALEPEDVASRDLPQPVLEAGATKAAAPSETGDLAGPAADPQTVGGTSVGGFLIAGAAANAKPPFDPPSGLGVKPPPQPAGPSRCAIETATFGGQTTVLVRTRSGEDVRYVALSVLDGFEDTMTKSFLAARPGGGEALGTYPTREDALEQARALCPQEG